jgi:hypothetical protein
MPKVSHIYTCPNHTEYKWDKKKWKAKVVKKANIENEEDPFKNITAARLLKEFTEINN